MDGSHFGRHEIGRQPRRARGIVWRLRRIHPVDGLVILCVVGTVLFAAMILVHGISPVPVGY